MSTAAPVTTTLAARWPGGRREPVRLGAALAEGGDATIHAVEGHPTLVAKRYRDPTAEPRRRAKLEAMLAAPPAGALAEEPAEAGREVQLAWPLALLEREAAPDGLPAGFLMPRVDLSEAALLEELLSGRARRARGLPEAYRFRVAVAANLAAVVAALHAQGHHIVDLKPANVHVYRASGRVAVLDCDGMSIAVPGTAGADGGRFPAHQYTDGYIAPEALRAQARPEALCEAADRFALAVIVFRLLNGGLHPFQGVPAPGTDVPTTNGARVAAGLYPYGQTPIRALSPPPSSLHESFGRATRQLFDRAFAGPDERPSAAAWRDHLRGLLAGGLNPCQADPNHARFGNEPCGFCDLEARWATSQPVTAPPPKPAAPPEPPPVSRPPQLGVLVTIWNSLSLGSRVNLILTVAVGTVVLLVLLFAPPHIPTFSASPSSRSAPREASSSEPEQLPPRPSESLARAVRGDNIVGATRALNAGVLAYSSYAPAAPPTLEEGYRSLARPDAVDRFDEHAPYTHNAALSNAVGVLSLLLHRSGVEVDQRDRLGRTPLMVAAWSRAPFVPLPGSALDPVVTFAADLSRHLGQAFRSSVAYDDREQVEVLWAEATRQTAPSYRAFLLAMGEDPGPASGPQALTVRESIPVVRSAVAVQLLLDAGADPGARDPWGRTALAYAASAANPLAVRLLLDAGADPNAPDSAGVTPLMVAADWAADWATDELSAVVVRELLRGEADATLRDRAGRSAAAFVGDRVSREDDLPHSITLALLHAAERGNPAVALDWDVGADLEALPTPPLHLRADVVDVETRLSP